MEKLEYQLIKSQYDFFWIGAAISAAGSFLGGALGSFGQQDTNKANLKIARESFEHDKQMWDAQNEYNSPENQMARYREAGLNPHLMFGSISPGNATNAPQFNAPRMENPYSSLGAGIADGANGAVQTFLNTKMTDANVRKANADATLAEARAKEATQHSALLAEQTATQAQQTLISIANAVSAGVKANVDQACEDVFIAIENQKLRNLSAQERDIDSQIQARNVQNILNRAKVTDMEFYRALQSRRIELDERIFSYRRFKDGQDYGLRLQSFELQQAIQAWNMECWTKNYILDTRRLSIEERRSNYEEDFKRGMLEYYDGMLEVNEDRFDLEYDDRWWNRVGGMIPGGSGTK